MIPLHPSATDPILLALPKRQDAENGEDALERMFALETNTGPAVERGLLLELLTQSPGLAENCADPHEHQNYRHPLASANAFKHRFHALRCEYVQARMQTLELEDRLGESQGRIERLDNHVAFLEDTLEQMRASRAWKWAEACSRWSQTIKRLLTRKSN